MKDDRGKERKREASMKTIAKSDQGQRDVGEGPFRRAAPIHGRKQNLSLRINGGATPFVVESPSSHSTGWLDLVDSGNSDPLRTSRAYRRYEHSKGLGWEEGPSPLLEQLAFLAAGIITNKNNGDGVTECCLVQHHTEYEVESSTMYCTPGSSMAGYWTGLGSHVRFC